MKFGIIGAGRIAGNMAGTIVPMRDVECTAIAARDLERAKKFAAAYGFRKAFGSYKELLADPEVELVYIAVPHSHHHAWTMKALEAGKHVLCEKAFAMNEKQAREMIDLAERKKLMLTEAMWTRYMPSRQLISDIIDSGIIGDVVTVSANLGYDINKKERIIRPELCGGALLDLTVYPLNFLRMVLNEDIQSFHAECQMTETGVDGQDFLTIRYAGGQIATVFTTIYTLTDRRGMIYGDKGFIEVVNINNPERILIYSNEKVRGLKCVKSVEVPPQISGYEYEVAACIRAIEAGQTECPEMPHEETLEIMRQMDAIRASFGIVYPGE